jgi:hypothetical protein
MGDCKSDALHEINMDKPEEKGIYERESLKRL